MGPFLEITNRHIQFQNTLKTINDRTVLALHRLEMATCAKEGASLCGNPAVQEAFDVYEKAQKNLTYHRQLHVNTRGAIADFFGLNKAYRNYESQLRDLERTRNEKRDEFMLVLKLASD